jgi:SMODS-associated and fused to various effectors sensor domain
LGDVPRRSPSGVRLAGDEYQHIVTWNEALNAARPGSDVASLTVEAPDAGNLDDIVIERRAAPHTYIQVKHAVDATTPVGSGWLTATPGGRRSLLGRFHNSWLTLLESGREPDMQLVTDREIDPTDPLMRLLDRRTELLVPAVMSSDVAIAEERAGWATHLGGDEDALVAMLHHLRFRTGRAYRAELERADGLMWGHGLATGQSAIDSALAFVRDWVQERWRTLNVDSLRDRISQRMERASDPGVVLVIESIDDDPHPEDAVERLRWVERYEGDDPNLRRQLSDPRDWQNVVGPQLQAVGQRLRAAGHHRVLVRGAMRLPVWFGAGAVLRHVQGFSVAGLQQGSIWSSDTATGSPIRPEIEIDRIGEGRDIAVAVGVAADPNAAVARYVRDQALSVDSIAFLRPSGGAGPEAVLNGPAAAHLAVGLRDAVRTLLEDHPAEQIHLFLAIPGALALLLGHRWNALRPTVVYEHLGAGAGYAGTLMIPA